VPIYMLDVVSLIFADCIAAVRVLRCETAERSE
jgi:hypothetical protein